MKLSGPITKRRVPFTGKAAGAGIGGVVALGVAVVLTVTLLPTDLPRFDGIEDLPLPGGADLGSHPYTVTAELADVLSLVPQSAVKVNDVAVGRVTEIRLGTGDWTARVTMKINGDIRLPSDASARLQQSSLLGEKFIELTAPAKDAGGARLTDGSTIPLARTSRNTEVEEVFGALSLLLNGGGVNQLKTITKELNSALGGREPEVRSMLERVNTLVTNLDAHRDDITQALDGVNRLSATLAERKKDVGTVLTNLSPGLKTLENQRGSLLTMLRALDTLSGVAVSTINAGKDDMVADLKALAPTLKALADAGADLPDSLQALLTYPFTDEVMRGIKGDYLNTYLSIAAEPGTQVIPPLVPQTTPSPTPTAAPDPGGAARGGASGSSSTKPPSPLPLPPVQSVGPAGRASSPSALSSPSTTGAKDGGKTR
ncbi:MCE family protein [Streptomyces sp. NBC_00335]|uniref:MCE family protein n=1 Tax=unclassified Streptomyces TaxID=2593676 RepID=UPI002259F74C|nr:MULTISPECIES: MCE family protein [unclassified Streptomyces]MCX5409684.1 MCE family protein [Streptomyces sp. NBC_00086]